MSKSTNELLAEVRRLTVLDPVTGRLPNPQALKAAVEALDGRLSGGGPLPTDWRPLKVLVLV